MSMCACVSTVQGRLAHSPNLADASRFDGGAADKKENLLLAHGHIDHEGKEARKSGSCLSLH